jgi:hypothetical protein
MNTFGKKTNIKTFDKKATKDSKISIKLKEEEPKSKEKTSKHTHLPI